MKLALLIVGVLIAAAIAWDAAERHYDHCIEAAQARVAPAGGANDTLGLQEEFDRFTGKSQHDRRDAVEGCSRLPW